VPGLCTLNICPLTRIRRHSGRATPASRSGGLAAQGSGQRHPLTCGRRLLQVGWLPSNVPSRPDRGLLGPGGAALHAPKCSGRPLRIGWLCNGQTGVGAGCWCCSSPWVMVIGPWPLLRPSPMRQPTRMIGVNGGCCWPWSVASQDIAVDAYRTDLLPASATRRWCGGLFAWDTGGRCGDRRRRLYVLAGFASGWRCLPGRRRPRCGRWCRSPWRATAGSDRPFR